jgi:hypothetical protein
MFVSGGVVQRVNIAGGKNSVELGSIKHRAEKRQYLDIKMKLSAQRQQFMLDAYKAYSDISSNTSFLGR